MIGAIEPKLQRGVFVFCTSRDAAMPGTALASAVATFAEKEGVSFVLPFKEAERLGFDCSLPMRLISLSLVSKLDGVGLTAAIATELAARNIPCNVVAAYHHDHIFVPQELAKKALHALRKLQRRNAESLSPA